MIVHHQREEIKFLYTACGSHRQFAVMAHATILLAIALCFDGFVEKSCGNTDLVPYKRQGLCGVPTLRTVHYEPGGGRRAVSPLSHPWQVSMRDSFDAHYGVAVLVRAKEDEEETDVAVTTALNCALFAEGHVAHVGSSFQGISAADVAQGRLPLLSENTAPGGKMVPIKACYPHPEARLPRYQHDIGIVILEDRVKFTQFTRPICLPEPHEDISENDAGIVVGWGTNEENRPTMVPEEVMMRTAAPGLCKLAYGIKKPIDTVCVRGFSSNDERFYRGDYGGPFMKTVGETEEEQYNVMLGIATEAPPVGSTGPALVTRLAPYIRDGWIHDMIRRNSSLWIE